MRKSVFLSIFILGYRIRLHFDGYSDSYDFWEYANSRNIFPPGWCKQHQQRLEPPKDWNPVSRNRDSDLLLSFPWPKYMADEASCKILVKGRRQVLAPKQIFTEPNKVKINSLSKDMYCIQFIGLNVFWHFSFHEL